MPALRALALFFVLTAPAHADLYRWRDPESGTVKFSNLPPSDPQVTAEVIPYLGPTPLAKAAAPGTPDGPVASVAQAASALDAQLRELFAKLIGTRPEDFNRAGAGIRQQVEAYEALRAELDRLDPAGAARRRNDSTSLLERLKQGFAAGFSPTAPAGK
jgi:uncharacterized protein DUF4124